MNQQRAVRLGRDLAHLALDVIDAVILHSPAVEFVKILAGSTDIDVKHGHVGIGVLVPDQHGVLGGIHTADLGAVGLAPVVGAAAAHALDEHDLLWRPAVGQALQVALGGAGGIHNPLQLQGGDDILALIVGVLAIPVQLDGIEAGGHHNGAVGFGDDLVVLIVVNGTCLADLGADAAFSGFELDAGLPVDHRHIGNGLGKGRIDGAAVI